MQQQVEYLTYYLGVVPNITIMPSSRSDFSPQSSSRFMARTEDSENSPRQDSESEESPYVRPSEVQLIDRIETAQLEGRIPYSAHDARTSGEPSCTLVNLILSKHGLKIVDAQTKQVLDRLPLHTVAEAVSFDDGLGHWNVAVKEEAIKVSKSLQEVFEKVVSTATS